MTLVAVDKGVEVGSKRTEPEPRQRTKHLEKYQMCVFNPKTKEGADYMRL